MCSLTGKKYINPSSRPPGRMSLEIRSRTARDEVP